MDVRQRVTAEQGARVREWIDPSKRRVRVIFNPGLGYWIGYTASGQAKFGSSMRDVTVQALEAAFGGDRS